MTPHYVYDGEAVRVPTPSDGVPEIGDDEDTALIATNPDNRGPEEVPLFGATPRARADVDTDKVEAFPEAAKLVETAEIAARWDVIGKCHDAMTRAGIPLMKASEIMAEVVSDCRLVPATSPTGRGPNGTLRGGTSPHGDGRLR